MKKLVDADKLKKKWMKLYDIDETGEQEVVQAVPLLFIDAEPDAREVACNTYYHNDMFECSLCHWEDWDLMSADSSYNYCPNCGAMIVGNGKRGLQ